MAVINKNSSFMDFPLQISRQYGAPIDRYEVFYSLEDAETYASSSPIAYVGQIIAVVVGEDSTATVDIYKINADGSLSSVGGTIPTDGKSIIVNDDGAIKLVGFGETYGDGQAFEAGLQLTTVSDGEGGFKLAWMKPDTTTVEGLTASVEALSTRTSNLETLTADVTTDHTKLAGIEEGAQVNVIESVALTEESGTTTLTAAAKQITIDLTNYATKADVDAIPKFTVTVVDELPETGVEATVYLVKESGTETLNLYSEYIYVNGAFEKLGEQRLSLDNYYTKDEVTAAINTAVAGLASETYVDSAVSEVSDAVDAVKTSLADYAKSADVATDIATAKTEVETDVLTQVNTTLESYDTSDEVDTKISDAVGAVDTGILSITGSAPVVTTTEGGKTTISLDTVTAQEKSEEDEGKFISAIVTDTYGRVTNVTYEDLPDDSNTFRPVQINGTAALAETSTDALNLVAGDNVTIEKSATDGGIYISAAVPEYAGSDTIEISADYKVSVKENSITNDHIVSLDVSKLTQSGVLVLDGGSATE